MAGNGTTLYIGFLEVPENDQERILSAFEKHARDNRIRMEFLSEADDCVFYRLAEGMQEPDGLRLRAEITDLATPYNVLQHRKRTAYTIFQIAAADGARPVDSASAPARPGRKPAQRAPARRLPAARPAG